MLDKLIQKSNTLKFEGLVDTFPYFSEVGFSVPSQITLDCDPTKLWIGGAYGLGKEFTSQGVWAYPLGQGEALRHLEETPNKTLTLKGAL